MNKTGFRLIPGLVLGLMLSFAPTASAEVDPFPDAKWGDEVGPRQAVSPSTGNPLDGSSIITCPAGAGLGSFASPSGNYVACVKTWRPSAEVEADAAFEQARRDGQAAAEAQSLAWNQAHPGQQKCFQWGPIVHANGVSTASGGVCANPVPVPSGYVGDTSTVLSNTETSTVIETSTVVETSTPIVISTPTPTAPVAPITSGLGGYAIVHPDGHVCGVIVATSNDPFGNGGTMTQEYMGCPTGARIVFQTTPSESGNVAGWHGANVTYDGSKFIITNGSNVMTITNGVATDSNGRVWDTGTGRVISAGTVTPPPVSDSSTSRIESSTVITETSTSTSVIAVPVSLAQETLIGFAVPVALIDTSTVIAPTPADDLDSLPEVDAEEEISNSVIATIVGVKTRIAVTSAWANTRLNVVASKKGVKKKYTYRFTTNSEGDYIFKSSVNLKGYTVILYKGTEELDRDFV